MFTPVIVACLALTCVETRLPVERSLPACYAAADRRVSATPPNPFATYTYDCQEDDNEKHEESPSQQDDAR